jgi:hypothetical protein
MRSHYFPANQDPWNLPLPSPSSSPDAIKLQTVRRIVQVHGTISATHPTNSIVTETQICRLFPREPGLLVRRFVFHDQEINCLLRIRNHCRTSHKLRTLVCHVSVLQVFYLPERLCKVRGASRNSISLFRAYLGQDMYMYVVEVDQHCTCVAAKLVYWAQKLFSLVFC